MSHPSSNSDDEDDELGDAIYKSSQTAKSFATAREATASSTCTRQQVSPRWANIADHDTKKWVADTEGQERLSYSWQIKRMLAVENSCDGSSPKRICRPCSTTEGKRCDLIIKGADDGGGCTKPLQNHTNEKCNQNDSNLELKQVDCREQDAQSKSFHTELCEYVAKKGSVHKRRTCSKEGCISRAVSGGVCRRHGAKRKTCSVDGCTNSRKDAYQGLLEEVLQKTWCEDEGLQFR